MDKKKVDDDLRALVIELKAVTDKLRAKGLDDDDLKDLLQVDDEKGITLSADGTLTLLDYGRKVKLSPMERALYTLLLNHEDGIRAEEVLRRAGGPLRKDDLVRRSPGDRRCGGHPLQRLQGDLLFQPVQDQEEAHRGGWCQGGPEVCHPQG